MRYTGVVVMRGWWCALHSVSRNGKESEESKCALHSAKVKVEKIGGSRCAPHCQGEQASVTRQGARVKRRQPVERTGERPPGCDMERARQRERQ